MITPPERTPALRAVHDNLVVQAPTPLQKGAVSLLRQPRSFFADIAEGYRQKRDLLVGGLREIGFAVTPPEGAYYLFADYRGVPALAQMSPTQAAMFLIEQVGCGHGAGRQLLHHRKRRRPLPPVRLLPFARDAGGSRQRWRQPSTGSVPVFVSHAARDARLLRLTLIVVSSSTNHFSVTGQSSFSSI